MQKCFKVKTQNTSQIGAVPPLEANESEKSGRSNAISVRGPCYNFDDKCSDNSQVLNLELLQVDRKNYRLILPQTDLKLLTVIKKTERKESSVRIKEREEKTESVSN